MELVIMRSHRVFNFTAPRYFANGEMLSFSDGEVAKHQKSFISGVVK
jgi:hypothetical protein